MKTEFCKLNLVISKSDLEFRFELKNFKMNYYIIDRIGLGCLGLRNVRIRTKTLNDNVRKSSNEI